MADCYAGTTEHPREEVEEPTELYKLFDKVNHGRIGWGQKVILEDSLLKPTTLEGSIIFSLQMNIPELSRVYPEFKREGDIGIETNHESFSGDCKQTVGDYIEETGEVAIGTDHEFFRYHLIRAHKNGNRHRRTIIQLTSLQTGKTFREIRIKERKTLSGWRFERLYQHFYDSNGQENSSFAQGRHT